MTPKPLSPPLEEPPSLISERSDSADSLLRKQALFIKENLTQKRLFPSWRISPEPFPLSHGELDYLQKLGPVLLKFYQAQNRLYFESVKGTLPPWISYYLDLGKPQQMIEFGRMNRFKSSLPGILRPDLILTPERMVMTELDSVPGGFGLTHLLNLSYEKLGYSVVGGTDGMTDGFKGMVHHLISGKEDLRLALVVSKESEDYLPEMAAFVRELNNSGFPAHLCRPEELYYSEEGAFIKLEKSLLPLTVIYRFLELFDHKNIPKGDLLFYTAKKEKASVTPPFKPFLEEKIWFALFHHPGLTPLWEKELGEETYSFLKPLIPQTWILDPRELPPYGVIPDLLFRQKQISQWKELYEAGQKERRLVIKPSGYSELAWGARGVKMGHDLSSQEWRFSLEEALASFYQTPHLLQAFHQGRKDDLTYLDPEGTSLIPMTGRTRLSPYYFTTGEGVRLGGILATTCPSDKKIIHGMADAVMAPCHVKNNALEK